MVHFVDGLHGIALILQGMSSLLVLTSDHSSFTGPFSFTPAAVYTIAYARSATWTISAHWRTLPTSIISLFIAMLIVADAGELVLDVISCLELVLVVGTSILLYLLPLPTRLLTKHQGKFKVPFHS